MRRSLQIFLFALILLLGAAFLIWPVLRIVRVGFFGVTTGSDAGHFTFGYVLAIFRDPDLSVGLLNSAVIAVSVTFLCALISVPLALLAVHVDFVGKNLVNGRLLVPLILPPFVGAIGMRQILGRFGALTAIGQDVGIISAGNPVDWLGHARILGV